MAMRATRIILSIGFIAFECDLSVGAGGRHAHLSPNCGAPGGESEAVRRSDKVSSNRLETESSENLYASREPQPESRLGSVLRGSAAVRRRVEGADPCEAMLPDDLKRETVKRFFGYSLPRVSDNPPGFAESSQRAAARGCFGVATGDFNGDQLDDYALLLTSKEQNHSVLIVGLRSSEGWRVESLRVLETRRDRLYVRISPPGKYRRNESLDTPPIEPGEVESFESKLSGIVAGVIESIAIYYFWADCGWKHVWVVV